MGIIYRITNKINDKCYIGQSIKNEIPKDRHINNAINGKKYVISSAIRKYGYENFIWEIIAECNSKEELNKMECYYIKEYHSHMSEKGYNMTLGGDGGNTLFCKSKEEKEEMYRKISQLASERQTGVPRTEKAKKALSIAQKRLWQNKDYRKKQTKSLKKAAEIKKAVDPEFYSRISREAWNDKQYRARHEKKYLIIFPDGSEKIIQGINRFCRKHGLSSGTLGMVVRGVRKSHKGYKARYYEE